MFRIVDVFSKCILSCGLVLTMFAPLKSAYAETVLYSFNYNYYSDGVYPEAGLITDSAGNLYGTTYQGGSIYGDGTVFELASDGTETLLHSFTGSPNDGAEPTASLIRDSAGNLYGTTEAGGIENCYNPLGCGTVFKVAPDGAETVLYVFSGKSDGGSPEGSLIRDKKGNLYGTTSQGGAADVGTIFEVTPKGAETVLHSFTGGSDGSSPEGTLIRDKKGNLYGTTSQGGDDNECGGGGCGVVFKLASDGTETVLHAFTGTNGDGATPYAGLIRDKNGDFYGTTIWGGAGTPSYGTVFKVTPEGVETVLHTFNGSPSDGANPQAGVILKNGNLYGTTTHGGVLGGTCPITLGCGAVFKLTSKGQESLLYAFCPAASCTDGAEPEGGLILDKKGNLYGTTVSGGNGVGCYDEIGCGVVFLLKK
jgi:uncharacterized repeat protein (TIGR03803 family)